MCSRASNPGHAPTLTRVPITADDEDVSAEVSHSLWPAPTTSMSRNNLPRHAMPCVNSVCVVYKALCWIGGYLQLYNTYSTGVTRLPCRPIRSTDTDRSNGDAVDSASCNFQMFASDCRPPVQWTSLCGEKSAPGGALCMQSVDEWSTVNGRQKFNINYCWGRRKTPDAGVTRVYCGRIKAASAQVPTMPLSPVCYMYRDRYLAGICPQQ